MALKLRFNLADVMLAGFSDAQRRKLTPEIHKTRIKNEFGKRAIQAIVDRTRSGKDKDGTSIKSYAPYSKAYRQSAVFKRQKRRGQTIVDLDLFGDMLNSVKVFTQTKNTVTIAIEDGEQEIKAKAHISGTSKLPSRDFWGLDMDAQVKILKSVFRDSNGTGD